MPAGDRTGPMSEGPLTGRGLGNCSDGTNMNNSDARPRRFLANRFGTRNGSGRGRGINSRGISGRGRRR